MTDPVTVRVDPAKFDALIAMAQAGIQAQAQLLNEIQAAAVAQVQADAKKRSDQTGGPSAGHPGDHAGPPADPAPIHPHD